MRLPAVSWACACVLATGRAFGVFAPIPEIEKGEPVVVDLRAGVLYDSNIFGADTNEQGSMLYTVSPQVRVNASLSKQTFLRGRYSVEAQFYEDRPGKSTVYNHEGSIDFSHSFSERADIYVYDRLAVIGSPEAALSLGGTTELYQADQSFWSNTFGIDSNIALGPRTAVEPGLTVFGINFDNDLLARQLDYVRVEPSMQLAWLYSRTTRIVAEGRYRDIKYDHADSLKGSKTVLLLGGFDYDVQRTSTVHARAGVEMRDRNSGEDTSRFYGQLNLRHSFAENSWVQAGAEYDITETDAISRYLDATGPVAVISAQIDPTGANRLLFTGTLSYAMRTLNARKMPLPGGGTAGSNADENVFVAGVAAVWNIQDRWSVRVTADYQDTNSDVPQRGQRRFRGGVTFNYTFGLAE